jgi:hypothetical protein
MFAAASATDAALTRDAGGMRRHGHAGDDDDDVLHDNDGPISAGPSSGEISCDVIVFEGTSRTMSKVR